MRRPAGLALAALLLAAACRGGAGGGPASTSLAPTAPAPSPSSAVGETAAVARARLCTREPAASPSPVPQEGSVPVAMRPIIAAAERIRGLAFDAPIVPRAESPEGLAAGLLDTFDEDYPRDLYRRRSLALATIGAIPAGTSLRAELRRFLGNAVVGYYDTVTGELVYSGEEDPSPAERVTLVHELVHALDDRTYGINPTFERYAACEDEAFQAALAVIEGSATYFSERYAAEDLTERERTERYREFGPTPEVAPFVLAELRWPYVAGSAFVESLGDDRASLLARYLEDPPTTTEQILHPGRIDDLPTPLEIPDRSAALGPGWGDLDVAEAGEAWLANLLSLRLDSVTAAEAAAGWDGGLYRAWTDGGAVAVELKTAWDTERDAERFVEAMRSWAGDRPLLVRRTGPLGVRVLFGSDPATLDALVRAVAGATAGVP